MTLSSSKVRGKSIMTAMSNKTCSVAPGVLFPLLCGASSLTSEECFRQGNTNKSTNFSACGGPAFHGSAFHGVFRIAPHEGGERQNTNWNVCALIIIIVQISRGRWNAHNLYLTFWRGKGGLKVWLRLLRNRGGKTHFSLPKMAWL